MNPGISPIAFYIGPWPVRWYGIIFSFVIILGTLLAAREAKRRGEDPNLVWDGVLIVVILGLIGSRIYHVVDQWDELYKNNPLGVLYLWNGGLGIYGAIFGGILGMAIFARSAKVNMLRWLDIAAPSLLLGQAIARWSNFINRELYGTPTDLPWAVYIEPEYRVPGYEGFARFQPLFLYESIWNFLVFGVLIYLSHRQSAKLRDGDIVLLYCILYSLGRFFLESLKIGDVWTIMGLRTAQIIAAGLIIVCTAILVWRHRRTPTPAEAAKPEA
jgi:phosphatidylglycerol---prolipoprotein diacylglyceryl transferase